MRQDSSNPERNNLPLGIKEVELIQAIEVSGYPLQGIVASKLNRQFGVTEEWGYIDRDSQEHRSIDVFAYKSLFEDREVPIQPSLVLLIECKRSLHPYVFFRSVTERLIPRFPRIAGLPHGRVSIYDQSGKKSIDASGAMALGLDKLPFVEPGPPKCAAFSKAIPSGKKVRLSGTDPFNSLILPLVKALEHTSRRYRARQRPASRFPTLILCISVLDAPMILVESPEQASDPILAPWVRVVRQEANPDLKSWVPFRFYAVDAVHIDSFDDVVYKHLIPFAEEFGKRAIQLGDVLFHGGEVPNLDDWEWDQIRKKSR